MHCEISAIEIQSLNIIIICIYRSPNGELNIFFDIINQILNKITQINKYIYIYGDFNINLMNNTSAKKDFSNLIESYNLCFLITDPTRVTSRSETCIDNCITNTTENCRAYVVELNISDHMGIINEVQLHDSTANNTETKIIKYRPYSKIRANDCVNILKTYNWDELNALDNTNDMFNYFFDICIKAIDYSFPIKTKTIKNTNKIKKWFTNDLKIMRDNLNFFTLLMKQNSENQELSEYVSQLKREYKNEIKKSKNEYICNTVLHSSNKSKYMWKVINEAKTVKKQTQCNNNLNSDNFNTYFANISINVNNDIPESDIDPIDITANNSHKSFYLRPVTEKEVDNIITNLSNSTAKDIYGISNKLLKLIKDGILKPLTIIINKCFENGKFPEKLKYSKITPIYKNKGDINDMNNHRPLAIIPTLSKPIEAAFNNRLVDYLERNNLFSQTQYGFRRQRSTIQANIKMVTDILHAFERREIVSATFCDLSKAFDCVCHDILIKKLPCYGIRGTPFDFIICYLHNRIQTVEYNGERSSTILINAGVPQGSILGPLLFLLYVNDFSSYMRLVNTIQYADDTTLYSTGTDIRELSEVNASVQARANNWFVANKLSLNKEKTTIMNFTLKYSLDDESTKFLGIILDKSLTWKDHINMLANKLSSLVFLLRKIALYVPIEISKIAYIGLFQSQLTYGVLIWGNSTEWNRIFLLQKMAIRAMTKNTSRVTCKPLFAELKILTFPALYIYHCLTYLKKNEQSFQKQSTTHSYVTRKSDQLVLPQYRLETTHRSFLYMAIKMYNHLPKKIKELPTNRFNIEIKEMLIELVPYNINEFFTKIFRE